jgi:hypothetical protein
VFDDDDDDDDDEAKDDIYMYIYIYTESQTLYVIRISPCHVSAAVLAAWENII